MEWKAVHKFETQQSIHEFLGLQHNLSLYVSWAQWGFGVTKDWDGPASMALLGAVHIAAVMEWNWMSIAFPGWGCMLQMALHFWGPGGSLIPLGIAPVWALYYSLDLNFTLQCHSSESLQWFCPCDKFSTGFPSFPIHSLKSMWRPWYCYFSCILPVYKISTTLTWMPLRFNRWALQKSGPSHIWGYLSHGCYSQSSWDTWSRVTKVMQKTGVPSLFPVTTLYL